MNKKLLRSLISITSVVGIATSIPFTVSTCSMSKEPIELECKTNIESIYQDLGTRVDDTPALDKEIYTDTHIKVKSGVTFTCKGLKEQTGLDINETTGVINGTLTKKPTNPEFKIKFTANVHGKQLEGYTNPFTITVNPTKLVIDKTLDPINANLDSEITPTIDISGLIKTDTEESVSGVTFTCEGLPNGLSINQSTGVIFGIPTHIQNSTSYTIKFSCTFKEIQLEGSTQINIKVNGPQSIVCSQIEDQSIAVNKSFSLGVADVKMVFDGGAQKSLSSSDIASYELLDDKGQSAASTLPQGLTFNTNNGSIFGTVTSPNLYAPTTYKIKITGSQRIGSVVGYSNTFTLSMKDNPLPETIYNIDTNNVLQGFKEGVDLTQYDGICDTMQIPTNVINIANSAFNTKIPSFITNITFAEGSKLSAIGDSVFRSNSSLKTVDLSNCINLTSVSSYLFDLCANIISIALPNSIITLGHSCFGNCHHLSSITIPPNLSTIEGNVFWRNYELTEISFPSSLTTIGSNAFSNCSGLKKIVWNANTTPTLAQNIFGENLVPDGTVKSTGSISSQVLLDLLKTKGLPNGWTVA